MTEQPEALRVAEALEQQFPLGTAQHFLDGEAAPAFSELLLALNSELPSAKNKEQKNERTN